MPKTTEGGSNANTTITAITTDAPCVLNRDHVVDAMKVALVAGAVRLFDYVTTGGYCTSRVNRAASGLQEAVRRPCDTMRSIRDTVTNSRESCRRAKEGVAAECRELKDAVAHAPAKTFLDKITCRNRRVDDIPKR